MKSGILGHSFLFRRMALFCLAASIVISTASPAPAAGATDAPPGKVVKLVFIHHSCGENWLADDNGGLGKALDQNNYFVSDTNYGWGPHGIGDSTNITDWPRWFTGDDREIYLQALYREGGQHAPFTRRRPDPGGENQIVRFKSCFPNSNLQGRPADAPRRGEGLTVANAKAIYSGLLTYFESRPDKLFIAITAPPVQDPTHAANARAFNRWLVTDWLKTYPGRNVAVFDFYNVLTGSSNHHRFQNGRIEHVVAEKRDTLYYPSDGDDHPSHKGNRKAGPRAAWFTRHPGIGAQKEGYPSICGPSGRIRNCTSWPIKVLQRTACPISSIKCALRRQRPPGGSAWTSSGKI